MGRYHPRHASRKERRNMALSAAVVVLAMTTVLSISMIGSSASVPGRDTIYTTRALKPHMVIQEYRVKQGDTLSSIARHVYGHASRWPSLWYANRQKIHNPNALRVGLKLRLSPWHPRKDWILLMALRHVPRPAPVLTSRHVYPASAAPPAASSALPGTPVASYSSGGSFRACVLRAESGGNYSAYNPSSGAGGAYQFLQSTWSGLGFPGSPQTASPAMQDAAFNKEYAQSGTSAWSPYDGC